MNSKVNVKSHISAEAFYRVTKWCLIEMRFFNYSTISVLVPQRITHNTSDYAFIMLSRDVLLTLITTAKVSLNQFLTNNPLDCTAADLIPPYLAVKDDGPIINSSPYQYQTAKVNHNSAMGVHRGPRSGVTTVSVPLVNNRKGSLLPPSDPAALSPSFVGPRDLVHTDRLEDARRLQRARSLPLKYRYHPGLSNNADHRHRKGRPLSPQP